MAVKTAFLILEIYIDILVWSASVHFQPTNEQALIKFQVFWSKRRTEQKVVFLYEKKNILFPLSFQDFKSYQVL